MSRINTNLSSLQAIHTLNKNNHALSKSMQRLSTGLRINSGKDDPAGLIASENMRSEITGINQAVSNSQRASNVINTAEGALSEISSLLLEVQSLTNQAANTGALSTEEIKANQLQVDAILQSINRVANTTQFNGVKLLNGSLDYTLSGTAASALSVVKVNGANIPDNGNINVVVSVATSAQYAQVQYGASAVGSQAITISVGGNHGTEQFSFAASTATSAIARAVNQLTEVTGVSATAVSGVLRFNSTAFGSSQYVSVTTQAGTFLNAQDDGVDADVRINGNKAEVEGNVASVRSGDLDLTVTLSADYAQTTGTDKSFYITGGGAKFQLGSQVNRAGQTNIGLGAVTASSLGNSITGFLSSLGSGGDASLVGGNTVKAQRIINAAIKQVSDLRGRLGAFQKNILDTNVNSLNVALENVTASESAIRDADFAQETAKMTRAQILVQANTSILAQANSSPNSVLSLLRGG